MSRANLHKHSPKLTWCVLLTFAAIMGPALHAQTFNVIYDFSLHTGYEPYAGVTRDAAGNLYGTTSGSGIDAGTVYELKRSHGGWLTNTLFTFNPLQGSDQPVGYYPWSGVVFGPDGALYGTTFGGGSGGGSQGYGIVYKLTPQQTFCRTVLCPWIQTVLYEFTGGSDGLGPLVGDVTFDHSGNLYGTTGAGGSSNDGVVYELSPANGGWTEQVLHSFSGGTDGIEPYNGVVFDQAGNLYGTTAGGGGSGCGGSGCGTVFELSPNGSGWTEQILYTFQGANDGYQPFGGLTLDAAGNLYGTTFMGGANGGGTAFELSPNGGSWNFTLLYSFTTGLFGPGGPFGNLAMDGAGSLYGTTYQDGPNGAGQAFKLTHHAGGGFTYMLLHNFTGGDDGLFPMGNVAVDAMGNVWGTASEGGTQSCSFEVQCGTVWEITP